MLRGMAYRVGFGQLVRSRCDEDVGRMNAIGIPNSLVHRRVTAQLERTTDERAVPANLLFPTYFNPRSHDAIVYGSFSAPDNAIQFR